MIRHLFLSLCLGCVGLLLAGCGGSGTNGGGSGQPTVAFVSNNAHEFWSYAEAGCRKAEKEFHVKVEFRRPPTGSASEQKQFIDALLDRGVQAIAVSVIDPTNQTSYLKRVAQQVPLLTQDNDAPESGRTCYIGTDNYKAGRAVGKLVKQVLPEGGVVAILVGQMEALNAQQRSQGVLDELAGTKGAKGEPDGTNYKKYGKYRLFLSSANHGIFTDDAEKSKSKQNADFVLSKHPNEKNLCLVGLWAYNPPTIYTAVKGASRLGDVKIVGMDEDKETLQGIEEGHIYGTVVQQPFEFGYQSVKIMARLVKGDKSLIPPDGINYVPHIVVTKDGMVEADGDIIRLREGVAAFKKKLQEQLAK